MPKAVLTNLFIGLRSVLAVLAVSALLISPLVAQDTPVTHAGLEALEQAAIAGDAGAQQALGELYRFGEGVPQDFGIAERWYVKAAEQGSAEAQFALGNMLYKVYRDARLGESAEWTRRAAEQGLKEAQFNWAIILIVGQGVEPDRKTARAMLKASAEQGFAPAQLDYARVMMQDGRDPASYAAAVPWLAKAAEQGEVMAQLILGGTHQHAWGIDRDPTKAAELYLAASKQGHEAAMYLLSEMYWKGDGLAVDRVQAAYLGLLSETLGYRDAQGLGEAYEEELSAEEMSQARAMYRACLEADETEDCF